MRFVNFLRRRKSLTSLGLMLAIMLVMAVPAFAADPVADADTVTAVTDSMNTVKATSQAILAAVAGIAIVLFAGIFAWKYGKKVFNIIAK